MDIKFLHENLSHDISHFVDEHIVILGCGAIGANLAIGLARRGFKSFLLFDYDKISEHNFSTQPWARQNLGRYKIETLALLLVSMTGADALVNSKKVESARDITSAFQTLKYQPDVIVDCFDNNAARTCASLLPVASHITGDVVHVGMSNQNTGEVTWNSRYTVPPDVKLVDPCNYPMSRTLVDLTVTAAAESVIEFLTTEKEQDYLINANLLKIEKI
jgi:ThiF family